MTGLARYAKAITAAVVCLAAVITAHHIDLSPWVEVAIGFVAAGGLVMLIPNSPDTSAKYGTRLDR